MQESSKLRTILPLDSINKGKLSQGHKRRKLKIYMEARIFKTYQVMLTNSQKVNKTGGFK
jgi:hypothetical protein